MSSCDEAVLCHSLLVLVCKKPLQRLQEYGVCVMQAASYLPQLLSNRLLCFSDHAVGVGMVVLAVAFASMRMFAQRQDANST